MTTSALRRSLSLPAITEEQYRSSTDRRACVACGRPRPRWALAFPGRLDWHLWERCDDCHAHHCWSCRRASVVKAGLSAEWQCRYCRRINRRMRLLDAMTELLSEPVFFIGVQLPTAVAAVVGGIVASLIVGGLWPFLIVFVAGSLLGVLAFFSTGWLGQAMGSVGYGPNRRRPGSRGGIEIAAWLAVGPAVAIAVAIVIVLVWR